MLKNKVLLFILLVVSLLPFGYSQSDVERKATLDSSHIVIGDQLRLHLSVATSSVRNLSIEKSDNWKLQNCEVVSVKPVASTIKNNRKVYTQEVILTSFDTGVAVIAPITIFEFDTLPVAQFDILSFRVDSLPVFVDTAEAFKDIKMPVDGQDVDIEKPQRKPIPWGRIIFTILLVVVVVGLIVFAIVRYLIPYLRRRREEAARAQLKENAGVVAIRGLKELKSKKLWQKGQVKDYYSELSLILRTYIDHQWGVNAKEMVTDEIMSAIEELDINGDLAEDLHRFFELSDLVKYAKEQPEIDKHEHSLKNAYRFVQTTDQMEHAKAAELAKSAKK